MVTCSEYASFTSWESRSPCSCSVEVMGRTPAVLAAWFTASERERRLPLPCPVCKHKHVTETSNNQETKLAKECSQIYRSYISALLRTPEI